MKLKDIENAGLSAEEINSLAITAFIDNNRVHTNLNALLSANIIPIDSPIAEHLQLFKGVRTLEDVISVFEQSIPAGEVVANGAIYTPEYIREGIIDFVCNDATKRNSKDILEWSCIDISCGCGAFLYTYAKRVKSVTHKDYNTILDNVYGVDISRNSITRTKILLSLMGYVEGETIDCDNLHLYVANTLSFNFNLLTPVRESGGFDLVIGNPPYVRAKHIDEESKSLLKRWTVARIGNADLYLPFFEIGLSVLGEKGILGYITVNSFFKSVNARGLRKYIQDNTLSMRILNFGQELIFKKKLAYTCLAFLSKSKSRGIHYAKVSSEDISYGKNIETELIPFTELDAHKGWNLGEMGMLQNISKIEKCGIPLSEYCIRNGIATLANDIFIFSPEKEDATYYYVLNKGKLWPVEKSVCKDIIKPNILKAESEIPSKREKVIFPYDINYVVLEESRLRREYPKTYAYLLDNREILLKRDKGNFSYNWYEFGRTQAINYRGKKLMFPYMTDTPKFVYTDDEEMLIYCGYAFYDDSSDNLLVLKKILESNIFYYYIKHTSKPYSTGYYSYAKNYLKSFGICQLTNNEKVKLLHMSNKIDIDKFLCGFYNLDEREIMR